MSSLRFNKKADGSTYSLTQLIGLVIAVLIVVGFGVPLYEGVMTFFKAKPQQGTMIAFDELANAIAKTNTTDDSIAVTYYIANDFKVVGFSKGEAYVKPSCGWFSSKSQRPRECKNQACLALCSEDNEGCRKALKNYKVFPGIDRIIVKDLDKNSGKENRFLIYGDCGKLSNEYGVNAISVKRSGNDVIISSHKAK